MRLRDPQNFSFDETRDSDPKTYLHWSLINEFIHYSRFRIIRPNLRDAPSIQFDHAGGVTKGYAIQKDPLPRILQHKAHHDSA